ncbi:hypothetical protein HNQ94_003874 [Salirhabdus euzebyi]|uniref:DUF5668 domain-containing protein n=1 Tax=Salirhabdus euzebyi TaxID=394506 RepID=A0A841QAR1_9BACI|nr:hypothetical protein [Salirhabdus euzebyi]MBB6455374.1 hypothetical protein [Salirhabdus euzebyi]
MRQWRIGTFSMGLLLVLLGVSLLLSNVIEIDVLNIALSWWPLLLIVVGLEIILFLFVSKEKLPFLKFDFLSMIFIGVLGFIGIGFFTLHSVGIVAEVKEAISEETRTGALPQGSHSITDEIDQIIIKTNTTPVEVERNTSKELVVFGTYETTISNEGNFELESIVDFIEAGNILYVQIFDGKQEGGLHYERTTYYPTISIPQDVKVEIVNR